MGKHKDDNTGMVTVDRGTLERNHCDVGDKGILVVPEEALDGSWNYEDFLEPSDDCYPVDSLDCRCLLHPFDLGCNSSLDYKNSR